MLGCPQAEVRAAGQRRGSEVIDTGERKAYLAAPERCDG